jgi:hypothetical protein
MTKSPELGELGELGELNQTEFTGSAESTESTAAQRTITRDNMARTGSVQNQHQHHANRLQKQAKRPGRFN